MDFVYILGKGSRWNDNEIRYSLRSLKYVKHDNVFIIGHLPRGLKNVIHVPAQDFFTNKQCNAIRKVIIACSTPQISDDFVLMNDDFFFLREYAEIPYYTLKDLNYLLDKYHQVKSKYYYAVENAIKFCKTKRYPQRNFEVHFPLIINKKKFLKMFNEKWWLKSPTVYRSIYANSTRKIKPIELNKDFKCYTTADLYRLRFGSFISTDNKIVFNPKFRIFINSKFPKKCKYEE
jgi:hypothetical protein